MAGSMQLQQGRTAVRPRMKCGTRNGEHYPRGTAVPGVVILSE